MRRPAHHILVLTLSLALAHSAAAQRPELAGTWELTDRQAPPAFERAPSDVTKSCDPAEAQLGLLRFFAQPTQTMSLRQSDTTLVLTTEDGLPYRFYLDGREDKLSLGAVEMAHRARWTPDGVLALERKPQFGGNIVESYTVSGSEPVLTVEQVIEHPALSQSVRRRFSYRRVAEPWKPPPASAQLADTAFRPVIERPAYPAGTGPVVLVDEAHANFHTATGRYLPFAELLRRDGYVVQSSTARFTPEALRAAKVLVIANALEALTADEVAAVRAWVSDGGSLLLITDHPPFVAAASDLARAFGIRLRDDSAADPGTGPRLTFRRADSTLADHAITRGIDEVVTFTGSSFEIDAGGEPLLVFGPRICTDRLGPNPVPLQGHLQGAVLPFGVGRIAVFGEAAMFSAQVTGASRSPMGMNAPVAKQNAQFLLNVMHWLTGVL